MKKLAVLLALFASLFAASAAAADFASVGTNYNLQGYYYSTDGWQSAENCNTFYPNISIARTYHGAYGKSQFYPRCAYAYSHNYYAFNELRPPFPYPYVASPRDLGYSPVVKRYASGSRANAYYANAVQVHLNDIGSTTYPPSFQRNSLSLANSYSNYGEQQYYLNTAQEHVQNERIGSNQFNYAYSGERWLTTPNYWYGRPGAGTAEPTTSSTFPPGVFVGFYYSNNRQAYYDQFQVNAPVNALQGKKALTVAGK